MMGYYMGFLFAYAGDLGGDEEMEEDEEDDYSMEDKMKMPSHCIFDEVLDKIFSHLSITALKTCRLVCQNWCVVSTDEINRRDITTLEFHQDKGRPIFRTPLTRKWLTDLNSQLEYENLTIIGSKFEFHGNMGLQDVRQFFKLCGPKMKVLIVKNLINHFTRWNVLHDLLLDAPNIQDLTILGNNFDFDASSTLDNVDMMIVPLPNLKVFRLDYETTMSTLHKILAGAPNLLYVENFDWPHVDIFLNSGRTLSIKELTFDNSAKHGDIENTCRILPPDSLIMNLGIPNPRQFHPEDRWCNSAFNSDLIKILTTIKDSLETLTILPLGWCQEDHMVFPALSSLKHLTIKANSNQPAEILPFSLTQEPKELFPKLETIVLDFDDYGQEFWTNCFPKGSKFRMVKQLVVPKISRQNVETISWTMGQIRMMFPNLTKLKFGCKGQDPEFLRLVFKTWNGARVEVMEFSGIEVKQDFEVDAVLTGIDKEDCVHLAESLTSNPKPTEEQVENVLKYLKGEQPSIRNFIDLRNLKMGFKPSGGYKGNPVSVVSYAYGFNLSSQPKVIVELIE